MVLLGKFLCVRKNPGPFAEGKSGAKTTRAFWQTRRLRKGHLYVSKDHRSQVSQRVHSSMLVGHLHGGGPTFHGYRAGPIYFWSVCRGYKGSIGSCDPRCNNNREESRDLGDENRSRG